MNSSWQQILGDFSPFFANSGSERPGDAAADDIVCPLIDLSVLRARGVDAASFLQNQLSNDLRPLADGDSALAAYCTPKGRMLALFRLIRQGDDYLLLVPTEIAAGVLKRLRMFVLRAKLSLEDVSAEWLVTGLAGARTTAALEDLGAPPVQPDRGIRREETSLLRLPGASPRYLLLAPASALAERWRALAGAARLVAPAVWRLLDIRDGLPQVYGGTQEAFVPQMANLDRVNGLSFDKGCYPGQEIVARMHFLGTLKRRMYRFKAAGAEPPEPGAEIRGADGALAGQVVMAASAGEGTLEGLAVLQIEAAQRGDLRLGDRAIEVMPPPYPLDAAG